MTARNLKVVLAYDGAPFSGWQVQPLRATVQGTLAQAIERITGEAVLPQGSGRTDTGVHALAQVATFTTTSAIPANNLARALNDILPPSIRVLNAEDVAPEFHARHSAKSKTYRYRIFRGEVCPPFLANYVYHYPYSLRESAMMEAAERVIGEHDFTSFAAADPDRTQDQAGITDQPNHRRTIFSSIWEFGENEEELVYTVRGNGFLHHMVRNLVGTFLLVGKGTLPPDDIARILKARQRSSAGATAPASGLYLVKVEY